MPITQAFVFEYGITPNSLCLVRCKLSKAIDGIQA